MRGVCGEGVIFGNGTHVRSAEFLLLVLSDGPREHRGRSWRPSVAFP